LDNRSCGAIPGRDHRLSSSSKPALGPGDTMPPAQNNRVSLPDGKLPGE